MVARIVSGSEDADRGGCGFRRAVATLPRPARLQLVCNDAEKGALHGPVVFDVRQDVRLHQQVRTSHLHFHVKVPLGRILHASATVYPSNYIATGKIKSAS
jgi:hypothetical protein